MVRGRSMGFVASGASKRTYAHELGHGAFGLEHTFPEIAQTQSNNLMDYGDSTHLTHKQCKDIAKRKFVFSLLDSEEDAAIAGGFAISPSWQIISAGPNDLALSTYVDDTPAPDGFLGGVVTGKTTKIYHRWNDSSKKYEPSFISNQNGYPTDNDVVWLPYDNSGNCTGRCIRTTYGLIKTIISTKDEGRLKTYIASITTTDKTQPAYSFKPPCVTVSPAVESAVIARMTSELGTSVVTSSCFQRAKDRALAPQPAMNFVDFPTELAWRAYRGIIEYGLCATEKNSIPTSLQNNASVLFMYGAANEIIETLDIERAITGAFEGAANATISIVKGLIAKVDCLTNKPFTTLTTQEILTCLGLSPADITASIDFMNAAWVYAKANITDPYVQGKMVVFGLTLFIPVVNAVKVLNSANKLTKVLKSLGALNDVKNVVKQLEKIKNVADAAQYLRGLMGCTEFATLKTKIGAMGAAANMTASEVDNALSKLCFSNNRADINTKLLNCADAEIISFLKDIIQPSCNDYNICDPAKIIQLTADHIEGWKIVFEGMKNANSNASNLAKNFKCVDEATKCHIFRPNENSILVNSLKTIGAGRASFLMELSLIATDANYWQKYPLSNKNEAFDWFRAKGSCPNTIEGYTSEITQNLISYINLIDATLIPARVTARTNYANNNDQTKNDALKKLIIDASEALGEAAGDAYFLHSLQSEGYVLQTSTFGTAKQGVFDRVYKKVNNGVTTIAVVECKGGTSPLGCRSSYQQGRKEYLESIILNMEGKTAAPQDFKNTTILLRQFYDANKSVVKDPNKVLKYFLVRQPFDDNNLKNTEIKQFQITW